MHPVVLGDVHDSGYAVLSHAQSVWFRAVEHPHRQDNSQTKLEEINNNIINNEKKVATVTALDTVMSKGKAPCE